MAWSDTGPNRQSGPWPYQTDRPYWTADEAEEEFGRREKTVNYFSLMVKKRLMDNKEDSEEGDEIKMDKTAKIASRTGNLVRYSVVYITRWVNRDL